MKNISSFYAKRVSELRQLFSFIRQAQKFNIKYIKKLFSQDF